MMKIPFQAKFGVNTIDLPINTGDKLYFDNASGLTEFNGETYTIINRIPKSAGTAETARFQKYTLNHCGRQGGIYDRTSGQMFYKANTWTVYLCDWQTFRPPNWMDGGYYALSESEQEKYFTANVGDLLIFADVSDAAPASISEFSALAAKYKDCGGMITGTEVYIRYKPNGTPWKTNHIEVVKG